LLNQLQTVWKWYLLALVVIVLDQITKQWAAGVLEYAQVERVTSFFYLTLRHNNGAAFSLFAEGSGWQRWFLGGLAAIVSVLLVVWIARLRSTNWRESCALALVLGGALGNLIDRALFGYVIDFIAVHYQHHEWPAFNIADSAICIGAGLMIWDAVFTKKAGSPKVESHG